MFIPTVDHLIFRGQLEACSVRLNNKVFQNEQQGCSRLQRRSRSSLKHSHLPSHPMRQLGERPKSPCVKAKVNRASWCSCSSS